MRNLLKKDKRGVVVFATEQVLVGRTCAHKMRPGYKNMLFGKCIEVLAITIVHAVGSSLLRKAH